MVQKCLPGRAWRACEPLVGPPLTVDIVVQFPRSRLSMSPDCILHFGDAQTLGFSANHARSRPVMRSAITGLTLVLTFAACEQKANEPKKNEEAKEAASAASTAASLNPEIANAVAAAAKTNRDPAASDNGPPPDGMLPLSRANAEAPQNAPAKLVIGGTGSDPKLKLGGAEVGDKTKGQMEVSVRLGPRSALPTAALELEVESKVLEGGLRRVSLEIKSAQLARTQPGEIPPEVGGIMARLKGSRFNYDSNAGKAVSFPKYELSKDGPKEMETLLSSVADAVGYLIVPLPEEPVGKGAFWMTTSRETFAGTDSVAYRMVKLVDLTPERAVLDVETRRYAASDRLGLPDVADHKMLEFQSNDKGQLVFVPGQAFPIEGRMEMGLGALLEVQGEQSPAQIQTRALFSFPNKKPSK